MGSPSVTWFKATVIGGYLASVGSGVWLGLFSCGGYRWHKDLAEYSLVAFCLAIAVFAARAKAPSRLLPAVGLVPAFLLSRSVAAPFYLGFSSLGEYAEHVSYVLRHGPC
jgi:hypothetical protein